MQVLPCGKLGIYLYYTKILSSERVLFGLKQLFCDIALFGSFLRFKQRGYVVSFCGVKPHLGGKIPQVYCKKLTIASSSPSKYKSSRFW